MTSQQFLVCDSSTLANFKQWASAISGFFTTAGWTQSSDTGQVNWSTIASVPGSGAYVYEIWQPNDGLTTFYLKVEYGNASGTNNPTLRLSIGSSTNGAGTLSGFFTPVQRTNVGSVTPPSVTTQYECDFSGVAGRMGVMMWRNAPTSDNCQQLFAVERSVDSSGAYTSSYVTLYTIGGGTSTACCQCSLVFGVGATQPTGDIASGFAVRSLAFGSNSGTSAFSGAIPFDAAAPVIGFIDYQGTEVGVGWGLDIAEGVTFTATLYSATRTYMPGKNGNFASCGPGKSPGAGNGGFAVCMRYD